MSSDTMLAVVLAVAVVCACDVREDRADCPCYLTLDWSDVDSWSMMEAGADVISWNVTSLSESWQCGGKLPLEEIESETELAVPRDSVLVMALSGAVADSQDGVVAEYGHEFPRLYFYCRNVDATGVMVRDTVFLHKEHAELFLYVRNVMQSGASYTVTGTVAGCNPFGRMLVGPFSARVPVDIRGFGSVVIPRQIDASLRLNVSYAGEVVRSLAIGEYILQSGYDWSAPDLEDIVLEIDYFQTKVIVDTEQWKKTLSFEVVF